MNLKISASKVYSRSVVLAYADVLLPSTSAALCCGLKLSVCAVTTAVLGWKITLDLCSTEFIGKRSQRLVTRAVALAYADILLSSTSAALCCGLKLSVCAVNDSPWLNYYYFRSVLH